MTRTIQRTPTVRATTRMLGLAALLHLVLPAAPASARGGRAPGPNGNAIIRQLAKRKTPLRIRDFRRSGHRQVTRELNRRVAGHLHVVPRQVNGDNAWSLVGSDSARHCKVRTGASFRDARAFVPGVSDTTVMTWPGKYLAIPVPGKRDGVRDRNRISGQGNIELHGLSEPFRTADGRWMRLLIARTLGTTGDVQRNNGQRTRVTVPDGRTTRTIEVELGPQSF